MRVEDGAQLEQTAQHWARSAEEEMRHVCLARVCERPGAVQREGDRAAVACEERLCQLAGCVRVRVKVNVGFLLQMGRVWRRVERGEGWRERRDRPGAFGRWVVLRCARVVGVGEEERKER